MIRSKASAALMKLKEIDDKYKFKKSAAERPSSASTISISEKLTKNVKNNTISGYGDTSENSKQNTSVNMFETYMEPNLKLQAPNRDFESSTVVVTIFDKSVNNSPRFNSDSTSKITIHTRSGEGEIGPSGEGNVVTTVDVTLHKNNSEKSTSLSSISEAIAEDIQNTDKESEKDSEQFDGNGINLEITVESTTSSKAFIKTDLPVSGEGHRYSDDSFEDDYSSSEVSFFIFCKYSPRRKFRIGIQSEQIKAILSHSGVCF